MSQSKKKGPADEHGGTMLLAILAATSLEVARTEAHGFCPAVLAGIIVLLAAMWFFRRWLKASESSNILRSRKPVAPFVATGGLVAAATIPLFVEVACAAALGHDQPLEFYLHAWFRNLMFGLIVMPSRFGFQRLGGLASLFLLVFASSLATSVARWIIVVLYAAVGTWWLTSMYWRPLDHCLAATNSSAKPQASRWRTRVVFAGGLPLLLTLGVLLFGGVTATTALNGFMPTSGGNRWYSESARAGVNDGDALIAGKEDASSFGPVESDLFLSSDEQSLYDMFNEIYGEPQKMKKQDRAIALASDNKASRDEMHAKSEQLRREFSAVRQRPSQPQQKTLSNRESDALLYVAGRTPLHLRMEVFDRFDGTTWSHGEVPPVTNRLSVREIDGLPWLDTHLIPGRPMFSGSETHTVKTSRLKSNRIPSPLHLNAVHIAKVDRADFFGWAEDGALQMNRESIPAFTVFRMETQIAAPKLLARATVSELATAESETMAAYVTLPETERTTQIKEIAKQWTGDTTRGGEQIEAVVSRLRKEYTLDPQAVAPTDCEDAVAHFLVDAKRGPDYLFASAASVVLRTLGYPTRTVSGFYAAPENYDRTSRHTTVTKNDVHFWTEVYIGCSTWITVEPTPGYAILQPRRTYSELLCDSWSTAIAWCCDHWLATTNGVLFLIIAVYFRREWSDSIAVVLWHVLAVRSPQHCIAATLWLLERRARLAGCRRPAYKTLSHWYALRAAASGQSVGQDLLGAIALAEWHLYANASGHNTPPTWSNDEIRRICRRAKNTWTLRQFRQSGSRQSAIATASVAYSVDSCTLSRKSQETASPCP
jgi:transglutaminase-like putative cysteine protease